MKYCLEGHYGLQASYGSRRLESEDTGRRAEGYRHGMNREGARDSTGGPGDVNMSPIKELQTWELSITSIRGNKVNKNQLSNSCKMLQTANLGVMCSCRMMKRKKC